MKKLIVGLILLVLMAIPVASAKAVTNPYFGKIIALDAGHGGSDSGAVNGTYGLAEKYVNLQTVYSLRDKLQAAGAQVVLSREGDETITSRADRIDIAKSKCLALGHDCDALVSIHHNGSSDNTVDGTLTIYNGKLDKPLAYIIQPALVSALGTPNLGYEWGGYGITVRGHLVSVLTEAYFVTNDYEAEQFLFGTRKDQEAQAIFDGLGTYFSTSKPSKK